MRRVSTTPQSGENSTTAGAALAEMSVSRLRSLFSSQLGRQEDIIAHLLHESLINKNVRRNGRTVPQLFDAKDSNDICSIEYAPTMLLYIVELQQEKKLIEALQNRANSSGNSVTHKTSLAQKLVAEPVDSNTFLANLGALTNTFTAHFIITYHNSLRDRYAKTTLRAAHHRVQIFNASYLAVCFIGVCIMSYYTGKMPIQAVVKWDILRTCLMLPLFFHGLSAGILSLMDPNAPRELEEDYSDLFQLPTITTHVFNEQSPAFFVLKYIKFIVDVIIAFPQVLFALSQYNIIKQDRENADLAKHAEDYASDGKRVYHYKSLSSDELLKQYAPEALQTNRTGSRTVYIAPDSTSAEASGVGAAPSFSLTR